VGCPCPKTLVAVGGSCALPTTHLGTCGPHLADAEACEIVCGRGEALDPAKGTCLSTKELADLPEAAWLGLHEGERLTCPAGVLELGQGKVGCRAANLCRFGTSWDGKACVTPAPCPVGSLRDGASCKPFVGPAGADLALWADKVLRPAVCALISLNASVETYHLSVDAPGNDLSHASSSVESVAPEVGTVRKAIEAYVEALRAIQGPATSTRTELTVTCPGHPLTPPKIEPKDPDAGP